MHEQRNLFARWTVIYCSRTVIIQEELNIKRPTPKLLSKTGAVIILKQVFPNKEATWNKERARYKIWNCESYLSTVIHGLQIMDELVKALMGRYPEAVLQFEDFNMQHATPLLARYRDHHLCFNDDVQACCHFSHACMSGPCPDIAGCSQNRVGKTSAG